MKIILTDVELNENFLPNSNITYDISYDGDRKFLAKISDPKNERGYVGFDDAPKTIHYTLNKPLNDFTLGEIEEILNYRGLNFEDDGFEVGDVFMEKSHITLLGVEVEVKLLSTTVVEVEEGESTQELLSRVSNLINNLDDAKVNHLLNPKEQIISFV